MTRPIFYLGDSHYQTDQSSGFQILDDYTGPPEGHAILLMADGTVSIRNKAEIREAGDFQVARGFAIVLLLSGPGSKNCNTEHQPWRLRSTSFRGWAEIEEPCTGNWYLAPPRDGLKGGRDRVLHITQSNRSIAYQSSIMSQSKGQDHYHQDHYHDENGERVEYKFKCDNGDAYAALEQYNEQLRNQSHN